jgi:hypothetical protein
MGNGNQSAAGVLKAPKIRKGLGLGALGLGLACLGCCLAPLLGLAAATGAGAAVWAAPAIDSVLMGLAAGGLALAGFWMWKTRRKSCCSAPGTGCGPDGCGLASAKAAAGKEGAAIPSCTLSPEAQEARIEYLRSGLLSRVVALTVGPGDLRFRFADNGGLAADLMEFIRFERECCGPLAFGLEWAPEKGPVTLVVKGPSALLARLKAVAER